MIAWIKIRKVKGLSWKMENIIYRNRIMSCLRFSEKELIQRELNEMRCCGEVLSIETEDDTLTIIIIQPPKAYYDLLKRLRVIERQEEPQDIFII